MKRTYTTMDTNLKRIIKHCNRDINNPEDVNLILENINREISWEDHLMGRAALIIDNMIIRGDAVHVYMPDKSFCDWIVSCVKELSSDNARILHENLGKDKAICLHFPTGQGLYSVGFLIKEDSVIMGEDGVIIPEPDKYKNLNMSFAFSDGKIPVSSRFILSLRENESNSQTENDPATWYAKLVLGLAMYISSFPEQLKDGIPEDLKHPSYHNNEINKCVSVSPKILSAHNNHTSPMAHYRVGHFRVLNSPFYKNKRFHCIFIEATFVKGHAKTVLPIV